MDLFRSFDLMDKLSSHNLHANMTRDTEKHGEKKEKEKKKKGLSVTAWFDLWLPNHRKRLFP